MGPGLALCAIRDDSLRKRWYGNSMSNKRSLLVLCARIGYNPPRR